MFELKHYENEAWPFSIKKHGWYVVSFNKIFLIEPSIPKRYHDLQLDKDGKIQPEPAPSHFSLVKGYIKTGELFTVRLGTTFTMCMEGAYKDKDHLGRIIEE